jgi:LysR family transcriptional regulator, low CO2-responsive transcriptional regulator
MARTPRPSLETIQAFSVFAETLNFSQAARALSISQPALHTKVGRLAAQLDLPLYWRDGRKLHLTRHGEIVARWGRQLQTELSGLLQQLAGKAPSQTVVLAAGEGTYLHLLGPAISAFRKAAGQDVRLTLLTANRDRALDAVRAGRANLAVAPLDAVPEGMTAHAVARVGQVLVVPKTHPLAKRKRVRLSDLADAQLVVPPEGQPHRDMLARALQSAGVRWQVGVEVMGWEAMLHFVRLGFGLAVVNDYCRVGPRLVTLKLPELPGLVFRMVHLKGVQPHGAMRVLVDAILQCHEPK